MTAPSGCSWTTTSACTTRSSRSRATTRASTWTSTAVEVSRDYARFDLDVNCRNTQAIHREVMKLYEGAVKPRVQGPPGRDAELVFARDEPATVAAPVARLCREDDIRPQDIVVLSSHGREKSEVYAAGLGDGLRFSDKRVGRGVYFSSIRGFKGLESPVVVLCELGDLDDETRNRQLYVGMSRARNHCVVVAPQPETKPSD